MYHQTIVPLGMRFTIKCIIISYEMVIVDTSHTSLKAKCQRRYCSYGGFHKNRGTPSYHPYFSGVFTYQPSSYGGTPILKNPHIVPMMIPSWSPGSPSQAPPTTRTGSACCGAAWPRAWTRKPPFFNGFHMGFLPMKLEKSPRCCMCLPQKIGKHEKTWLFTHQM